MGTKRNLKQYLTDKELFELIENGLSDFECLSDDDDELLAVEDISGEDNDEEILNEDEETMNQDEEIEDVASSISTQKNELDTNENTQEKSKKGRRKKEKSEKDLRIENFFKENNLTLKANIKWTTSVPSIVPKIKWYEENIPQITNLDSPFYFFSQYFTEELLDLMTENTNLYAVQQGRRFSPTDVEEMKTFIGIHILMGNLHYPRIKCYWQPKLQVPEVANSMSVNRFYQMRQNLHFVNTMEPDPQNTDRMWKVRPLFKIIRNRCLALPLETQLCIDEQMVPFKGNLNVKQYIKNKPTKWGVKIFALCGRSGILYDFLIYQGSTTELKKDHSDYFGLGGSVISTLSDRITGKNFQLYFDNYFSNYNILQYLHNKDIYATCTARVDRFNKPPLSAEKDMRKIGRGAFEEIVSKDKKVILTQWYDNKTVVLASNYIGPGTPDICQRWDKAQKKYIDVTRPEVVKEYNACMGGVDKLDFLITIHRTFIRSKKWTLRMFTHGIDLACANSWLEYKKNAVLLGIPNKKVLDLLTFRAYIAEALIKSNKTHTKKRGRPTSEYNLMNSTPTTSKRSKTETRPIPEVRFDNIGHLPSVDGRSYASRCKNDECKGLGRIMCVKCGIHLCLTNKRNCFLQYHTK